MYIFICPCNFLRSEVVMGDIKVCYDNKNYYCHQKYHGYCKYHDISKLVVAVQQTLKLVNLLVI